jgi:hypothetical protein
METPSASFRAKFVAWLFVSGFAYIVLLFVLPYSFILNLIWVILAMVLATGYYVLMKTKPTLPSERYENWRMNMICWIGIAIIQILPLFS